MKFELDKFNGIIIGREDVPADVDTFHAQLADIVALAHAEAKNIIWLTLPIGLSHLVPIATELGFVFHNCLEDEVTLIHKAASTTFIPFIPTHTLGAGAIVKNSLGQLLVIKEHGMKGYKLPGGHIELGEKIETAIIREVLEETGVETEFDSILGFTTRHPFQFGKTNMYLVCKLTALSEAINIHDTDEIAEAKWLDVPAFLSDDNNAHFNRQMVDALHDADGLKAFEPENNTGPYRKHETFFAKVSRD
ncbi:NUDIX domain-containing protein [Vibrio fluvialis]|nr:NUDIX domain-containing protein [Vibrio fluvialis]